MNVNNEDPTAGTAVTVESSQTLRAEPRIQLRSCSGIDFTSVAGRAAATMGRAPAISSPPPPRYFVVQCVKIGLVTQLDREDFESLPRIIFLAIVAPIHEAVAAYFVGGGVKGCRT
jgi:hypothetical protein